MNDSKIIFIERLNFVSLVDLFLLKGTYNKVVMHETYACSNTYKSAWQSLKRYKLILQLLFSAIEFSVVPEHIDGENLTWEANQEALVFLNNSTQSIMQGYWGKYLLRKFESEYISAALLNCLREEIARQILFFNQGASLEKIYGENLQYIIPAGPDYLNIRSQIKRHAPAEKIHNKFCLIIYRIRDIMTALVLSLEILLRPFIELVRNGLSFSQPSPESCDVAQHVCSGFDLEELRELRGINSGRFDDELWHELKGSNISFLYVFSIWGFPKHVLQVFYKHFAAIGVKSGNELSNRIPLFFFLRNYIVKFSLSLCGKILADILKNLSCDIFTVMIVRRILLFATRFELFLQYHRPRVFISRDDYAFTCAVRTIILNSYGLQNFGISHSQCTYPKYLAGACFTYCNTYLMRGKGYKRIFYPYLDKINKFVMVGPLESDQVYRAKFNKSKKEHFQRIYGKYFNIILPISRPSGKIYREDIVKEKYENIPEILELDEKVHIILRPRRIDAVEYFADNFPLFSDYIDKGRISIETNDFTTYELLAYCNIVITEDNSGIFFETLCVDGAWPIAYAVRFAENPLEGFYKDFVAYNLADLKTIIAKRMDGVIPDEATLRKIERTKEEFAPYGDDKSWQRIADSIRNELISKDVSSGAH
ncbi:hypothetical protein ACFL0O_01595 [Thermodesulfobacteriota bacterium]